MSRRLKHVLICASWCLLQVTNAGAVETFDEERSCSEVRLDLHGGPVAKLPVYSQVSASGRDLDLCYSISSSLLIDANRYIRGYRGGQLTSPLALALKSRLIDVVKYWETPNPERRTIDDSDPMTYLLGFGATRSTLLANQGDLLCDQRRLETKASLYTHSTPVESFFSNLIHTQNSKISPYFIKSAYDQTLDVCRTNVGLDFKEPKEIRMPNFLDQVKEVLGPGYNGSPEQKEKLKELYAKNSPENRYHFYAPTLSRLLEAKNPVAIEYLYRVSANADPVTSTTLHASVVVGRKFNRKTGACEVLVRDSYGPSCVDTLGIPRYRVECQNGQFWIELKKLTADLRALVWIPK